MNDNPINDMFWASFTQYALDQPEFRAQFTADTGKAFIPPPTNAIAAMIDKSCGVSNKHLVEEFMVWATIRHWGFDFAPSRFAARILEMRAANELPWATDADFLPSEEPV